MDSLKFFRIMDNGVGIFKKIQKALKLDSIKEAIFNTFQ